MRITENLLTVNPFSRPGTPRDQLKALIMHWTAVPMQPAREVRDFFESRKDGKQGYGSAHYVIDQSGDIIRCIPETEIAWHVGSSQVDPMSGRIYTDWAREKFGEHNCDPTTTGPNVCTIGVEMCPVDSAGTFTQQTLDAATELACDICRRLALNPLQDIGTHHLVVGWKDCPRLWVNHPDLFVTFKQGVLDAVQHGEGIA